MVMMQGEKRPTGVVILAIVVVVVVVIGVAALLVPALLPKSPEERYAQDLTDITRAVNVHASGYPPKVATRRVREAILGLYPTFARINAGKTEALREENVGNGPITTLGAPQTNPTGAKEHTGTPSWEDVDGDLKRTPGNEPLYYHDASPAPTVDHWNTTSVTVNNIAYVVDSRDWFIDLDDLIEREYLDSLPESASPDNSVRGTGSYSWYVDENGEVRSMLYSYPRADRDGFLAVYP